MMVHYVPKLESDAKHRAHGAAGGIHAVLKKPLLGLEILDDLVRSAVAD